MSIAVSVLRFYVAFYCLPVSAQWLEDPSVSLRPQEGEGSPLTDIACMFFVVLISFAQLFSGWVTALAESRRLRIGGGLNSSV
jgi:hypothetical protein